MKLKKRTIQLYKKHRILTILLIAVITAALVAVPIMTGTAMPAFEDDFIIPVPIANPQTPDEEFFNMRLEFFLPETEPLIKETFGTALRFEDDVFWEYESYSSRAVSFATNLPTLAKIEYGPDTQYGYTTEQTESYYYQHLFHLTGLEPGAAYHYRIKARGSDGQVLISEDYTFVTPTLPADIIRIPQDLEDQSLPYRLTGNNKNYLLTQDIFAPNGGIVLSGHNVTLDLGGHTIIYDNKPNLIINENMTSNGADLVYNEDATSGVRCGMWNFRNQKVFNGIIIQGANGGTGLYGHGYNPLLFPHTAEIELAGITVDYYGDSVNGIYIESDNYIHHNVVYDRGSVIDNRHQQIRAITANGASHNVISYNSVRRCRQTGIAGGWECRGNEIYGDSFAPNSYLLGYNTDSMLDRNKIFGLGYNPIGIGGGVTNSAVAVNNFIYVQAYAPTQRDLEYNRLSGVSGFRWQIYGDNEYNGVPWDNNIFSDNVIVAKAWPGAAYIRALWLSQSQHANGNRVENNIVKVEAMSDDVNSGDASNCFTCIDINTLDDILYSEDFDLSVYEASPSTLIADNRFITNMSYLVCGTGYTTGSNAALYRNTFEKIDSFGSHYMPFRLGYWYLSAVNNKIIDSITGSGVDLSVPAVNSTYYEEVHLQLDIGVSSQRVYADAATGAPLINRTIAWQMDGGESGTFSTDGSGEAYREWITTHNEHSPGQPSLTMSQTHNTTVTFTADGYAPVTKNIAELQGAGPAILFGGGSEPTITPPTDDPKLVPDGGLGGGAIQNANTIRLTFWSYAAYDGAEIYRSDTPNGPFNLLVTEYGPSPYYDTDLRPTTTYYYKIRLFQDGRYGPLTDAVALMTDDVLVEGLGGGAIQDANTIRLTFWSYSVYDGAEIYRSDTPNGPFNILGTEHGPSPYYDNGLRPDTTYYYKIRLLQNGHLGPLTDAVALKTSAIIAEDFHGRVNTDNIELNWWCRSEWEYAEVWRSTTQNGDDFIRYATTTQASFFDMKIEPGATYRYKIRLVKDTHIGPFTEVFVAQK